MDSPFFEWGGCGAANAGLVFQLCVGAPALKIIRTIRLPNRRQQKRATLTDSPFFEWEPGNVLLSQEGESGAFRSTAPATGTSQAMLESG
jgi:hypothetical protein